MTVATKTKRWSDKERIDVMLEGARQFGTTLDEQRIYNCLRQLLMGGMPMDGLLVSSFDPATELMTCEYGWSDGEDLDITALPPLRWNRDGQGMQSKVILTGKAEIFDVASAVQATTEQESAPPSGRAVTKTAMMAPMILEGRVTGVVQVMSGEADAFTHEELGILEGLVMLMTAAWHHARLFRKAEEGRRMIDRIVATSPDMIYIFDLVTGLSTFSNGKLTRMLGYEEAELSELGLGGLLHPDDYARMPAQCARFENAADGDILENEYRVRSKGGEWRWFLSRETPFERDSSGTVTRILGLSRDITARKEQEVLLERRVAQRTSDLEAAVRELEGFTYSVSHDLRGPLRAISAASMILREDFSSLLPPEAQQLLLRQADAAKRMGALIDDLLKLSRLGRQELHPETFDLSAMAAEIAHELRCVARVDIQEGMEGFGDPRLVRFVLLNLIENAVKFSPPSGVVRVHAVEGAFAVSDEGIGFEMEYEPKIFRPFERLVREEEYPGTGIGLANAHRIVQRHGGRIWAESEPGKGSTFYFTLQGSAPS